MRKKIEEKTTSKKVVKPKVSTKKTSTKETKPKKSKDVSVEVSERPYPQSWKEMDNIDKKIIKLTENLKTTIIEGIKLISTRLETEEEQSYREDLKDYLDWITKINKETEKFYNFGK